MTERIKQDINALVEQPRQPRTLPPVEPVGGIPAGRGVAVYQASGGGGGGGIASPLTEGSGGGLALARTYHPPRVLVSSDGLFMWEVAPVATIRFTDADGAAAEFRLAVPTEPDP